MDFSVVQGEHRALLGIVLDDLEDSVRREDPDFLIGIPLIDALPATQRAAGLSTLREHLSRPELTWAELAHSWAWISALMVHLPRLAELELAEERLNLDHRSETRVRMAIASVTATLGHGPQYPDAARGLRASNEPDQDWGRQVQRIIRDWEQRLRPDWGSDGTISCQPRSGSGNSTLNERYKAERGFKSGGGC